MRVVQSHCWRLAEQVFRALAYQLHFMLVSLQLLGSLAQQPSLHLIGVQSVLLQVDETLVILVLGGGS